jgi:hypothetical protein
VSPRFSDVGELQAPPGDGSTVMRSRTGTSSLPSRQGRTDMTIRRVAAALAISAVMVLSACGGGGGDDNPTTTPPSNNWDSMIWDQGSWG